MPARAFFRHPPRVPPTAPGAVVAPADGMICVIDSAAPPAELGMGDTPLPRVSIFLSMLDAHVQRAPVSGEVIAVEHRPGRFGSADLPAASTENERTSLRIRTADGADVVAVQIAGLVARRIVCDAHVGDKLSIGDTYGLIRFGSRLDTYLPPGTEPLVQAGPARGRRRDACWPSCHEHKLRSRRPMNLQILPSAMTVLSICAGLTSIKFALEHQPMPAMALIAAAAILDGLDGRVARILDAQSRMGAEIDSLADAVNFGVTPALVVYVTLLSKSPVGWVVVLLYAVCVVLRLARFNALQDDGTQPAYAHEFFVGMPAPAGAVSMIGLIGLKLQFGDGWWTSLWFLCFWITGTSMLMVSRIPMRKMHAVAVPPELGGPAAGGAGDRARRPRCWRPTS